MCELLSQMRKIANNKVKHMIWITWHTLSTWIIIDIWCKFHINVYWRWSSIFFRVFKIWLNRLHITVSHFSKMNILKWNDRVGEKHCSLSHNGTFLVWLIRPHGVMRLNTSEMIERNRWLSMSYQWKFNDCFWRKYLAVCCVFFAKSMSNWAF